MRRLLALAAVLLLPAAGAGAAGIDCRRAQAPVERMICADPALVAADAAMARSYDRVRLAATPALRPKLAAGQRSWQADRDRCRDAGCVATRIAARAAGLAALAARVSDANPGLPDLQAVWLSGSWQPQPAIPSTRSASSLPPVGERQDARAGALCVAGACADFGLERQALAAGPGREALAALLGVTAATPFYLATIDGRAAYGLVPLPDGRLAAVMPGCDAAGAGCGWVRQDWRPAGADAALHQEDLAR